MDDLIERVERQLGGGVMGQSRAQELLGTIAFVLDLSNDERLALTERVRRVAVETPRSVEDVMVQILQQIGRGVPLDDALAAYEEAMK